MQNLEMSQKNCDNTLQCFIAYGYQKDRNSQFQTLL